MLDGFAEPAALMRDDAEQMLGLGEVRLRLEDAAADRLGLHQPAFAAAALGISSASPSGMKAVVCCSAIWCTAA